LEEYLTVKNYLSSSTINLKGYVVKDAPGNRFMFPSSHYLQPGDYIKLRGGQAPTPTPRMWSTATTATSCPVEQRQGHHLSVQALRQPPGRAEARTIATANGYISFHS
jgi:hypothetical protein